MYVRDLYIYISSVLEGGKIFLRTCFSARPSFSKRGYPEIRINVAKSDKPIVKYGRLPTTRPIVSNMFSINSGMMFF